MWNTLVARAELLRLAATMVENDDRVEEAEALTRLVFNKEFNDEHVFRLRVQPILDMAPGQMDRMIARIRLRDSKKRASTPTSTEG